MENKNLEEKLYLCESYLIEGMIVCHHSIKAYSQEDANKRMLKKGIRCFYIREYTPTEGISLEKAIEMFQNNGYKHVN